MCIGFLQENCKTSQADDGMPSLGQIFPYVLRLSASDRRWCLRGIQITLVVRLAARMSSRSLTSLRLLPFYPFSCAVVRRRAHGSLVANDIGGGMWSKRDRFCHFLPVLPGIFGTKTGTFPFIVSFAN